MLAAAPHTSHLHLSATRRYWQAFGSESIFSLHKKKRSPINQGVRLTPSAPPSSCRMLSESNCGEGLSGWIRKSSSFWLTKYHKCPGGSAATLIKHIRQLTGEYLQRTLRLSLDLAQEINNSPDRYNPWQIWGIGEGAGGGGAWRWDEPVSGSYAQFGLTEAIKLQGPSGRKQESLTPRHFCEENTLTWV